MTEKKQVNKEINDRLHEMYEVQKKFNNQLHEDNMCETRSKVDRVKELILGIISECDEVLRETSWKSHRTGLPTKPVNSPEMLEEITDIMKYTLSLYIDLGFTEEDIYNEFMNKSSFVEERYRYESAIASRNSL